MKLFQIVEYAVTASAFADIVRHRGPGCTAPQAECPMATQGNCCRAPFNLAMSPMRATGVSIILDQSSNLAVSVPYTRGDGTYCGKPVINEATFGSIGCYQNTLLGSGLYIECPPASAKMGLPSSASDVIEKRDPRCPNQLAARDENGSINIASKFTDEYGNSTDEAGFLDAMQRMEEGIAKYGETRYHLHKQTGIAPEDMVFAEEELSERAVDPIALALAGIHHCTGEILARITQLNKCYTKGEGSSIQLTQKVPNRCVLNTWAGTPDCSGDSMTVAVAGSATGCYTGTNFDSVRLDCTQLS